MDDLGVLIIDGDGSLLAMDATAAQTLGCDARAIGSNAEQLIDKRKLSVRIVDATRPDGPKTFVGILHDAAGVEAELLDRTAKLQEANNELESFCYSVSHDLRAPLRAIDGFSALLMEEHSDALGDDAQRMLLVVRNNTARMTQMISDLTRLFRLGSQPLKRAPVDMNALVTVCFSELAAPHEDRKIDLETGNLPKVRGDAQLLEHLWRNLISNAIKYSRGRDPARIVVQGEADGRVARYSIADNGVGFDTRYADRLFSVFARLHSQKDFEGVGVGLALAHRIVRRHEGKITATAAPDKGATFTFELPA